MNRPVIIFICLINAGCMSADIANNGIFEEVQEKDTTRAPESTAQMCQQAKRAISGGHSENLFYYAPLHMEKATELMEDARYNYASAGSKKIAHQQCIEVRSLVSTGLSFKKKTLIRFKQSHDQIQLLKELDTSTEFTDDIFDFNNDIREITILFESGNENEASKEQADLMTKMIDFEIGMKIKLYLSAVETMLEKADDEDAAYWASSTYEKAENAIDSARRAIRKNFRNQDLIDEASRSAMKQAKHAYYVAKEAKTFRGMKPTDAEKQVLLIESLLDRINQKLGEESLIGHSLYEQSDILSDRVEKLQDRLNRLPFQ